MVAETKEKEVKPVKPGKTFNFSLTGDDFHLYETVRDIYQDAEEEDDTTVEEALAELDPKVRELVQARITPKPARREISQRQVFVRALVAALAAEDAATDGSPADSSKGE